MKFLDTPRSGSQAGTTASRGRYGQYYRTRAMPTQPRTDAQIAVRQSFGSLAAQWKTLTAPSRNAWTAWADNHPRVDTLGQTIRMSGFQAFVGVNQRLMMIGQPATTDAPEMDVVSTPEITIGVAPTWTTTIADSDPLSYTAFYCSPPKSLGTSFNGDYRFLFGIVNDDTGPTAVGNLSNFITNKFGTVQSSAKYFIRWYYINVQGVCSPWFQSELLNP